MDSVDTGLPSDWLGTRIMQFIHDVRVSNCIRWFWLTDEYKEATRQLIKSVLSAAEDSLRSNGGHTHTRCTELLQVKHLT